MDILQAPPAAQVSRRKFLRDAAVGTGSLVVGFHVPFLASAGAQATGPGTGTAGAGEINAWVVVHPDERVVIRVARSEMGQGSLTGLAQLVAEELDCAWAQVSTEYPTPGQNLARNRVWGNFSTGGSRGIRESNEYVRQGGAAARTMLIQAAADGWKVPASECSASVGTITHAPSGRKTSYGKVAGAAAKLAPPAQVALKDPKDWKIAGKPVKRLDTAGKLNGSQVFGMDLKLPGMLNAAVKDCPVFGGTLKRFDASALSGRPGVKKVVTVGDTGVAVIADTWWHAKTALDALPIEWDEGPNAKASSESVAALLRTGLDATQAVVGNSHGDALAALAAAPRRIEAVYAYPHQAHATMEVMNATVIWTPDRCQAWCPTQNGEAALAVTAEAAGLPPSKCDVYKLNLGGGFGRRGAHDWLTQAVLIAKQMPGTPVKMLWTREEDMQHDKYHPVTQCKMTAGVDEQGNVTAWHMRISGQSITAGLLPQNMQNGRDPVVFQGLNPSGAEGVFSYKVPNLLIDHAMRNPYVPPGFWRGVNLNHNAIYVESFIDEIAFETRQDPLALRRKMLADSPQNLAVLDAVAERAGWGTPPPDVAGLKVYRGLAQIMGFGSFVAACAEVTVGGDGDVRVRRIVAATDPGHAVNPQQIEAQVEGSFAYGLSAALYGGCTLKDGRIEQSNFNDYPVMLMVDMPKVEAILMPSGGFWGGVGEPTIAVAAPAVLNAIFAATGKRIRNLPLKANDMRQA